MSEDAIKNELAEDIATEEVVLSEEESSEEEIVLDEGTEELEEASKKEAAEEEEEEEEKKESVKEETPSVNIPKTKAGVIQAAVDMLKSARKEDAQKLFAKMAKVDETSEEDSIKSVDDAMKKVKKAPVPMAKAKVESLDFDEDLDALVKEEATLSEEFRGKAGAIFEAVLTSKLTQEIERLEGEYAQNLEEEVSDLQSSLVEKVDSYLNYVVENWMKENEVAIHNGLRTEVAEDFMTSLQGVFKEHYIEVPEGKVDLVDELNESVNELEVTLNKTTEDNIELHNKVQVLERAEVVREKSEGLAETEAEKLASLVEDIEFDNKENFETKVQVVKESYFKQEVSESVDEVDSLLGEDNQEVDMSDSMAKYTQAITNFTK